MRTASGKTILRLLLCAGLFLSSFAGTWADLFRSVPEQAERAYRAKQYDKALELYQEAQTRQPDSDTLAYNLGNSLYQLGRYDEASKQYGKVLEKHSPTLSPRTFYNMGNSLYQMGKAGGNQKMLEQALTAYKNSISLDSKDEDSKYNYELVRQQLKKQKQQQQQQQQQDQQNQQQKPDQKKDQKEQQQQEQSQPKPEEQKQEKQPQAQPGKMSREEADRILNALMRMEKEKQQKDNQKKAMPAGSGGPDW